MRTVTREAVIADTAAAFAIADEDGACGILGEDGKVSAIIGHPLEAKEDPAVLDLRDALRRTVARLENYIAICSCPGITACRTCDQTQGLVNEMRALLR